MIDINNLVVHRGRSTIISDVSFRVAQGEVMAVVGSNGAGKSTLLRAIAGDLPFASGTIEVAGLAVSDDNALKLARRRAILSQSTVLSFGFRVFEVVQLGRLPHAATSTSRTDELRIIQECLDVAGVSHLRDRSYPSLSGGEQQRVQIARALAQVWDVAAEDRVLLLDEPTSALDMRHQQGTLATLRRLADAGSTVLVILHDLNLAARYADRCLLLHGGAIEAVGRPAAVFTPTLLSRAFGVRTTILEHPEFACPLIVTLAPQKAKPNTCTPFPTNPR